MYSTCLYCTRDLGRNDVVETLPIGRRIAFDATTGRLWVVCRQCEKWNLVPFDTRLETIDACARLFSDARLRYSTDNIGIARLAEGLELVRIGPAQRPEFAAWRYGDQFGRRRRRSAAFAGATVLGTTSVVSLAAAGLYASGAILAIGAMSPLVWYGASSGFMLYKARRPIVTIPVTGGIGGVITASSSYECRIIPRGRDEWGVEVPLFQRTRAGIAVGLTARRVRFWGHEADGVLGRILPALNGPGASSRAIRDAVTLVADRWSIPSIMRSGGMAGGYFGYVPRSRRRGWRIIERSERHVAEMPGGDTLDDGGEGLSLLAMPVESRLALEMLSHEASERAALSGELKLLERQWREADGLAKIADGLAIDG